MSAEPPRVTRVYETVVYGPDLGALATFYGDLLGLRQVSVMGELGLAFRLPDGGMLLAFDPAQASVPGRLVPSHGAEGPGHIALSMEPGDLDHWVAHLEAHGLEIEKTITWRAGGRSVYVRDPAGNSVELVADEAWPE